MIERRQRMVNVINERGAVSFSQLKSLFPDISDMTLRNDLRFLDSQKLIIRVHGGARSLEMAILSDGILHINKRSVRNIEKKNNIAQKAVKMLLPGTSVFLGSGSTCTEMARCFPDQPHLVMTSGLMCSIELAKLKSVGLYILGGKIDPYGMCVTGPTCSEILKNRYFDIAFIGVTSFMPETGFASGSEEASSLKRLVMERAETKVLLMDSSKVGISSTFTFAFPKEVDVLVSDDDLDAETKEYLQNNNVKVL